MRTENISLHSAKFSEGFKVKIVQISDVHLGIMGGKERLQRVLDAVSRENPDILISTGDLVDGPMKEKRSLIKELSKIKPRYGKFAVLGNHEFYAGGAESIDFTEKSGFKLLREENVTILNELTIAGIDDFAGNERDHEAKTDELNALMNLPKDKFTIFLKHRPIIESDFFDIQLSGHTHDGQIFPFSMLARYVFGYKSGMYNLSSGKLLYVTRGAGTWGPPVRFLAPPEITVFELTGGRRNILQ